jgi:cytoskeletal protein CcmA (bactofilin family)
MASTEPTCEARSLCSRVTRESALEIRAAQVQASSRVAGDIHHVSLAIAQGAEFDGRCRRAADASELTADLPS